MPHPIQQQKNVELCLNNDEKMSEDSEGVIPGCASGSNYGNPCEVTIYVPVIPSCSVVFLSHVEDAFFKSLTAKGRLSAYCFRRA